MPWTIDTALRDRDITVVDRDDQVGDFTVQVGSIPTMVSIRLRRWLEGPTVEFHTSHAIRTPLQMSAYWTGRDFNDDAAYALHQAISGLTSWYRQAVDAGHTPDESWLEKRSVG